MPFVDNARNLMLNTFRTSATHASLHSAFPGATGTNEVTGGGYARQAATYNAAASGAVTLSGTLTFSVPAGNVAWLGAWSAVTAGTFYGYAPNGGFTAIDNFTVSTSTDTITAIAHGYSDTQQIVFFGGTPPGGLTEGTIYFVKASTADTFQVAATSGGAAIDLTSVGSLLCVISRITVEVFASAGSATVSTFTHNLNMA